jgi:FO synthase
VRVEAGKLVDAAEVEALLAARGEHLDRLMAAARRIRDSGCWRPVALEW